MSSQIIQQHTPCILFLFFNYALTNYIMHHKSIIKFNPCTTVFKQGLLQIYLNNCQIYISGATNTDFRKIHTIKKFTVNIIFQIKPKDL